MAANPISSNSIVKRPEVYIEPGTGPSIQPLREPQDTDQGAMLDEGEVILPSDDIIGTIPGTISAPENLTVISQTIRVLPDGTSVVDVVLDVEEVLGASRYEVRFI